MFFVFVDPSNEPQRFISHGKNSVKQVFEFAQRGNARLTRAPDFSISRKLDKLPKGYKARWTYT
jgi:hypothetical protein